MKPVLCSTWKPIDDDAYDVLGSANAKPGDRAYNGRTPAFLPWFPRSELPPVTRGLLCLAMRWAIALVVFSVVVRRVTRSDAIPLMRPCRTAIDEPAARAVPLIVSVA